MGDVSLTLKVMPEGKDVDLDELREKVESEVDPHEVSEEEVAFGLKALKVVKVIPEEGGGGPDEVEEKLLDIDNVKDVRVTDQRKLM